jgi:hypothetical protein
LASRFVAADEPCGDYMGDYMTDGLERLLAARRRLGLFYGVVRRDRALVFALRSENLRIIDSIPPPRQR